MSFDPQTSNSFEKPQFEQQQQNIPHYDLKDPRRSLAVQQNEVYRDSADNRESFPEKQEKAPEIQSHRGHGPGPLNENMNYTTNTYPNVTAFTNSPQKTVQQQPYNMQPQTYNEQQYPQPHYEQQYPQSNFEQQYPQMQVPQNSYRNISGPQPSPSHYNPYPFAFPPTQGYFIPATYAHQFPPPYFPNEYQVQPTTNFSSPRQNQGERPPQSDSKDYNVTHQSNEPMAKAPTANRANPLSHRGSEPVINTNFSNAGSRKPSTHYHEEEKHLNTSGSVSNSARRDSMRTEDRSLLKQVENLKVNPGRSDRRESHFARLKEQSQQVASFDLKEETQPDDTEMNHGMKTDKQIQAGRTLRQKDEAIQNPDESIHCKATQTTSRHSKHGSKRDDVPLLNIGCKNLLSKYL